MCCCRRQLSGLAEDSLSHAHFLSDSPWPRTGADLSECVAYILVGVRRGAMVMEQVGL